MKKYIIITTAALCYSIGMHAKQFPTTADSLMLDLGNHKVLETRRTQSIATINSSELDRNATPNLFNALYGLLPGLTVMQNTGWNANASLYVRGGGSLSNASPLIVVDGIPRPIDMINLVDIESVSVLKDGAATALWGARGANGVVVVTTKRGIANKRSISFDYKFGMGMPVNQPEFADSYNYALARNEALRNDGLPEQYSLSDRQSFKDGSHPLQYPNTNWQKEALRKNTDNHQLDVVFRGGGERLRYYAAVGYKYDRGLFNQDFTNLSERYNSQLKNYHLNARMNLDIDLTSSTQMSLSLLGVLREDKSPDAEIPAIFSSLYNTPSAAFPVRYGEMWASNSVYKNNPLANIFDVGYYKTNERMLQSDLRLKQDLSMFLQGFSLEAMVGYDSDAVFQETGSKGYRYQIGNEVFGDDRTLVVDNKNLADQYLRSCLEFKASYDRKFDAHQVNASVMYRQEYNSAQGRNNTFKRQYITAMAGYNYKNRYLLDVAVNQYGTSVLSKNDRFRTYPAVSAAWVISNESFAKSEMLNTLKLRASWGRSGYDGIGYELDRQYWAYRGTYYFQDGNIGSSGFGEGPLPTPNLTIDMAEKFNVGIDALLFNRLSFNAEVFYDKRKNILVDGASLVESFIGIEAPKVNKGAVESKGVELALQWKDGNKDWQYYVGGNFSFQRSKVIENGEKYKPYSYLSSKGLPVNQIFGLEAIGYFSDQQDIDNSYPQMFSSVKPGDIKYKDQNGDQRIDDYDIVRLGYSSVIPEIYYGINLGVKYKDFGIDVLFQGVANYSKMLSTTSLYYPLRNNTNISKWYLEDKVRWTEETKDIANVPRLTTTDNANNFRASTQWLVDGSFFKLRNVNIYYNLPEKWMKKMKIEKMQIYARANNLFSLDKIKYLNNENMGVNYPDMVNFYFGINFNF